MKTTKLIRFFAVATLVLGGFTSCSKSDSGSTRPPLLNALVTHVKGTITSSTGTPIAGVAVTDGVTIQVTDGQGRYEFRVDSASRFVYISCPSGYLFPMENYLVSFYTKLRRRANLTDTLQVKNWVLTPTPTNDINHIMIAFGDPQMKNYTNQATFIDFFTEKMHKAALSPQYPLIHIMTCGDLLGDRNDLNSLWTQISQNIPIPIFNTIGNHDHNKYIPNDDVVADDNYENSFGPTYYSFNRGKVHYIGLDDILYEPISSTVPVQQNYKCPTFVPRILDWLEKDIALVPSDYTIVVAYHCPITYTNNSTLRTSGSYMNATAMLEALIGEVSNRKIHLVAGHTHTVYNSFNINNYGNVLEHVVGATCGAWWRDAGVCNDGAPNGYGVFDIRNQDFKWYYKTFYDTTALTVFKEQSNFTDYTTATGLSWQQTASNTRSNCVVVNVWNWDLAWKVEWDDNGTWRNMNRATGGAYDPVAYEAFKNLESDNKASTNYHMFYATPPTGAQTFTYRVTDRFQNVETITKNLTQAN